MYVLEGPSFPNAPVLRLIANLLLETRFLTNPVPSSSFSWVPGEPIRLLMSLAVSPSLIEFLGSLVPLAVVNVILEYALLVS